MPRPQNPESEPAYRVWAFECAGNDTCTAQRLEMSIDTLRYWKKQYGWQQRRQREMMPELWKMINDMKVQTTLGLPEMIDELRRIATSAEHDKDRIAAIKAYAGIHDKMVMATIGDQEPGIIEASYREATPAEQEPAGYLESNVMDAERKWTPRRRR